MVTDVGNTPNANDSMRLCPECRMAISTLANRCRFCGTVVGRPRKESETLTVKDLGGEARSNYTVSGNVMEALESFISEERASKEASAREREEKKRSWFNKKPEDAQGALPRETSLPPLDPMHSNLSSTASGPTATSRRQSSAPGHSMEIGKKLFVFAAVIAGLVLLGLCVNFSMAKIKEIRARNVTTEFVYPNRAQEILESGQPPVVALEEALTAVKHNDTPENRAILEKVRGRLLEDAQKRLNTSPFSREAMDTVSSEIARATMKDTDPKISGMRDFINKELDYHKFVLVSIDEAKKTATFKLNNPSMSEKEQTVGEGELLQDRFLVKRIGPTFVRLEDPKVVSSSGQPRTLMARVMMPISGN